METQHTPGPWTISDDTLAPVFRNQGLGDIYAAGEGRELIALVCDRVSKNERIANARLIADAPALLSALREILHTERRPLDAKSTSLTEADMQEWFERRQRARENALALIARLSP